MTISSKPLDLFWFIPVSGDGAYLGTEKGHRPAEFSYLKQIAQAADRLGFKGVLIPTGRGCDDPFITASALAAHTEQLKYLVALRPGVASPSYFARQAAALDRDGPAMRAIRGGRISIIFQEPMTSLSPLHTVGDQISEALHLHRDVGKDEGKRLVIEMLRLVGFPDPERAWRSYAFELSGGLRQRAMIAMALICRPALLIADEPTTALDVTIQAQILRLIRSLRDQTGMGVLLITHDLGVIAGMVDRVVVMYAGQVMEEARVKDLFARPRHPYTRLLLKSVPRVGQKLARLHQIKGAAPPPSAFPSGCRFHPRCPDAIDRCRAEAPSLTTAPDGRRVRCWRADDPGLAA